MAGTHTHASASPRRGRASACGQSSPHTPGSLASCEALSALQDDSASSSQDCKLQCGTMPMWYCGALSDRMHCTWQEHAPCAAGAPASPGGECEVAGHHAAQHLRRDSNDRRHVRIRSTSVPVWLKGGWLQAHNGRNPPPPPRPSHMRLGQAKPHRLGASSSPCACAPPR